MHHAISSLHIPKDHPLGLGVGLGKIHRLSDGKDLGRELQNLHQRHTFLVKNSAAAVPPTQFLVAIRTFWIVGTFGRSYASSVSAPGSISITVFEDAVNKSAIASASCLAAGCRGSRQAPLFTEKGLGKFVCGSAAGVQRRHFLGQRVDQAVIEI